MIFYNQEYEITFTLYHSSIRFQVPYLAFHTEHGNYVPLLGWDHELLIRAAIRHLFLGKY